jgi:hypothetical protein
VAASLWWELSQEVLGDDQREGNSCAKDCEELEDRRTQQITEGGGDDRGRTDKELKANVGLHEQWLCVVGQGRGFTPWSLTGLH